MTDDGFESPVMRQILLAAAFGVLILALGACAAVLVGGLHYNAEYLEDME